jgi:hypothetical protein
VHAREERGQAAVELLAIVPALALVLAALLQLAVLVHAGVEARSAARVGARAAEVGAPPAGPARAALDPALARRARVTGGAVTDVELMLRVLPGAAPVRVSASAGP